MNRMVNRRSVRCWGSFELDVPVPCGTEAWVRFEKDGRTGYARAFDDGGRMTARFVPDEPGSWEYEVEGVADRSGSFVCVAADPGQHGPVRSDGLRFRYADGSPYVPIGTTAMWWHEQCPARRAETLASLSEAGFTKVRMSVLPGKPVGAESPDVSGWPTPQQLTRIEQAVRDLGALGVEAELVLFHARAGGWRSRGPGPGWQAYLNETVSRLAAFPNVSWCLVMDPDQASPPDEGWDEALRLVRELDGGRHLLTIHGDASCDFGLRDVTHASVRSDQVRVVSALTDALHKPVVVDSCGYEGDAPQRDASLTGEEVVVRLWEAICRGGYATHGEWFVDEADLPWCVAGGTLKGSSARRIGFLRTVMAGVPAGVRRRSEEHDASTLELPGEFYLQYYGPHRFRTRKFSLPPGRYRVAVLDTWEMTVREVPGTFSGDFVLDLPGKLYQAVRIERC